MGMLILAIALTLGLSFAMEEPKITAKVAIVMDYDIGQVFYEKKWIKLILLHPWPR